MINAFALAEIFIAILAASASAFCLKTYRKLTQPQEKPIQNDAATESKASHYLKHHSKPLSQASTSVSSTSISPSSTTTPTPSTVEKHPYVTINGHEPEEPQSFFHSRRFIAVGAAFAVIFTIIFMLLVG